MSPPMVYCHGLSVWGGATIKPITFFNELDSLSHETERHTHQDAYMAALDAASVKGNIQPFAEFVGNCVREQQTKR